MVAEMRYMKMVDCGYVGGQTAACPHPGPIELTNSSTTGRLPSGMILAKDLWLAAPILPSPRAVSFVHVPRGAGRQNVMIITC